MSISRPACGSLCRDRCDGFTLIEILVTVAIVGVLASVAAPVVELAVQRNKEQELQADLRQIRTAIDAYKQAVDDGHIAKLVGESGYPHSLADLMNGVEKMDDPKKSRIYFLRRIPRDPMSNDPSLTADQTWGTRSYESGPDNPQAGADVFDVYTYSEGVGLNGIAYRDW